MVRLKLEPQFLSPWTQRLADRYLRKGTLHVPVLGVEEEVSLLDTSIPEHANLAVPLEPQKLERRKKNLNSRLLQLPRELLIHVISFLPEPSCYMVHQTCRVLRGLTETCPFQDFCRKIMHREEPFHIDNALDLPLRDIKYREETFYIDNALCGQLRDIKQIFLRRSLCIPCGRLFDSGELEERMKKLWLPVYCTECHTDHPELVFPQGGRTYNICVGLLGEFAPCKHLKVSGKAQADKRGDVDIVCLHPDHFPAGTVDSKETAHARIQYRPHLYTCETCAVTGFSGGLNYSRSIPLVKIAPQQYPGMSALKSRLFKQLKESQDGLCQHASTQLDSIISSLPSDKCGCFPRCGPPALRSLPKTGANYRCGHHGYNCRLCGARYCWYHLNGYITLGVQIRLANNSLYGMDYTMGWISNIKFDPDNHPVHLIWNESSKGVLWCSDPSCGTGSGNRWLLMVEILKRALVRRQSQGYPGLPPRDYSWAAKLPYTLEYQVFQNAADWMTEPDMLSKDLNSPMAIEFRPVPIRQG
ncbi:unnamed protein product [Fusarium venenatum]|uniref:F-box domain-containing protein n=1 Tax=Fusarium venenatum TaxID=56646 RepID=A0A2L2SS02_9HYPO|nr:uncharacterized protein FVRRES_13815 [Fusarium venenatum]KAH6980420.1 hypothetical protein EDB82DRAFT_284169 [Fusarium venenatum]CEI41941.1 unnamed protein product [Fusarium venenatum]